MKWKTKCILCIVPSLLGILLFYILPFIKVLYYSFVKSQFDKSFVGFRNYIELLQNSYFLLALKNSLLIILICVPLIIVFSVLVSVAISGSSKVVNAVSAFFILPMIIPTAAIVPIWNELFGGIDSALPVYLLFFWKNIGICVILISAAISLIPKEVYEAAALDGAGGILRHIFVTVPCAVPSILFAVLLSIVNSFRIYKESFLYYGTNYPPEHSYTLQYFMNNNFLKLDYQSLSSGSVINTVIILMIVFIMLKVQRKYSW